MKNPLKDKTEPTSTTVSISCDKSEDNYGVVLKAAKEHQKGQRFEEAANAFLKAAELAYSCCIEYTDVVSSYKEATKCFIRLKDDRAFTTIMKAAGVYVETRYVERGIEFILENGYKCCQEFGDMNKADELYQKADELRSQYKLSHTCVITEFVESEFGGHIDEALKKAYHIYNKVVV
ncbi:hypothetical protein RF11_04356 [Thelohanellus kitauei]|uniref:Alpha-soluble NSF attachment protein n=1 Tax=Thelohanellus kitauei TaxID=669202 RepID=A0A0C2MYX5_THEKT|nr:hypothetical protein RF11_04356 [Thelohanellus kitauei]